MKAKPTARKMYVLYFTCLSHPLKIDGTSEGHRFKQEHHSLQVPDPDLWMHCVCFSEKFWPPKHMRVPGLGLVAAGLACLFSSYDGLLDGQGEGGETMSPRRPEGLWVKTVSEGRADSTGKSNWCQEGLGRDTASTSGWRKTEILSGAHEPSGACHNPESYAELGGEEQPGRAEEEGGNSFLKPLFMCFLSYLIPLNFLCPKELIILVLFLMIFRLFNFKRLSVFSVNSL